MVCYLIATVLFLFGVLFWIIDVVGGAIRTKGWAVLCIIASAVTIAIKFCCDNPEGIKAFLDENVFR